jgi:hypothetical protein
MNRESIESQKPQMDNTVDKRATRNGPIPDAARRRESYTAIVYFHGIGTPRRHEEISRLTDALDQFADQQDYERVGRLRDQKIGFEPSRVDADDDFTFVQAKRLIRGPGNQMRSVGLFRIYEGYWSPSTAGGFSALQVLLWFFGRFGNPLGVLLTVWRSHQKLRLTTLYRLCGSGTDSKLASGCRDLEAHYRNFESWPARRKYPKGTFSQFLSFVREKHHNNHTVRNRNVRLALRWRRKFNMAQCALLLVSATIAIGVVDFILLSIHLLLGALGQIGIAFPSPPWPFHPQETFAFFTQYRWVAVVSLFVYAGLALFAARGIKFFLSNVLADVMFWTTLAEKDTRFVRRRDILRSAERVISQVLRDPNCARVVVIGHSLGSAIAHECLMSMGRHLKARAGIADVPTELTRLDLISHLVTVGCPIDRIHYFFELFRSRYHRYNRIRDRLRGDTNDPPFVLNNKDGVCWVNIWNRTDLISSRLFSPRHPLPNDGAITDLEANSTHVVNPLRSHVDYFFSTAAMRVLFEIIFFNRVPAEHEPERYKASRTATTLLPVLTATCGALLVWALFVTLIGFPKAIFPVINLGIFVLALVTALGYWADRHWPLRFDQNRPASEIS